MSAAKRCASQEHASCLSFTTFYFLHTHTYTHAQLKTSEADVKRLISERRALMSKFADIEVVEGSVRELYVQMKVRGVVNCVH